MLKRRKRFIALIIVVAILPLFLYPKLSNIFVPDFAPRQFSADFTFPTAMKLDEMHILLNDFQKRVETYIASEGIEVKNRSIEMTGREGGGLFSSGNSGSYNLYYSHDVNRKTHLKIGEYVFAHYNAIYPGVEMYIRGISGGSGGGGSGGAGFSLEVVAKDYNKLLSSVSEIKSAITKSLGSKIINVQDNQAESSLEYALSINREEASAVRVSLTSVIDELATAVQGKSTAKYINDGHEYNVLLRLTKEDRIRSDIPERLFINSSKQNRIPVANLLTKEFSDDVQEIRRKNYKRTISISGDVVQGYSARDVVKEVRALLAQIPQDDGVQYFFAGDFKKINTNFRTLALVFLLAVLFIYGIMASQFESLLDPFIIIFTVPLTFAGVVLIYYFTGNAVSVFTLIGLIMLVGIAVNHGIVLVDYMHLQRSRGLNLTEAIVSACGSRFQPILMTTATTVLGLLPIVILRVNGVEMIKPIALTVVGGLSMSALLSFFYIPLIYYGFHSKAQKFSEKRNKRLAEKEAYTIAESYKFIESYQAVEETDNNKNNTLDTDIIKE